MGQAGIGIRTYDDAAGGRARRGQFTLCRIDALNPLTGEKAAVLAEGKTTVRLPETPVTEETVAATAKALVGELERGASLKVVFRTPTRIIEAKRLVRRPWLGPLVRRLLERLDALRGAYAGQPPWPDRERLVALADQVRLVEDQREHARARHRRHRAGIDDGAATELEGSDRDVVQGTVRRHEEHARFRLTIKRRQDLLAEGCELAANLIDQERAWCLQVTAAVRRPRQLEPQRLHTALDLHPLPALNRYLQPGVRQR